MGYIQVQFYQNDFNNNYCGVWQGLTRSNKCCPVCLTSGINVFSNDYKCMTVTK